MSKLKCAACRVNTRLLMVSRCRSFTTAVTRQVSAATNAYPTNQLQQHIEYYDFPQNLNGHHKHQQYDYNTHGFQQHQQYSPGSFKSDEDSSHSYDEAATRLSLIKRAMSGGAVEVVFTIVILFLVIPDLIEEELSIVTKHALLANKGARSAFSGKTKDEMNNHKKGN